MSRLLLGLPLYVSVSTNWLIRFLELDKSSVAETIAIRKMYLASAMRNMVEWALTVDGWDRLVVYEADMMPPRDALTRIAAYPDELDVVGSLYFQHDAPFRPHVYEQVDAGNFRNLHSSQIGVMVEEPGIYPCDAVGFGFTSVHRRVLEKWDRSVPMFESATLGHDLWFCSNAREQGFGVAVDSAIQCGHLTEVAINYDNIRQGE